MKLTAATHDATAHDACCGNVADKVDGATQIVGLADRATADITDEAACEVICGRRCERCGTWLIPLHFLVIPFVESLNGVRDRQAETLRVITGAYDCIHSDFSQFRTLRALLETSCSRRVVARWPMIGEVAFSPFELVKISPTDLYWRVWWIDASNRKYHFGFVDKLKFLFER